MDVDEKALRRSRDPLAWLALADLLEERGDDAEAQFQRQLGAWAQILIPLWTRLCKWRAFEPEVQCGIREVNVLPGGWRMLHVRTRGLLRVTAMGFRERYWNVMPNRFRQSMEDGSPRRDWLIHVYNRLCKIVTHSLDCENTSARDGRYE